MRHLLAFLCGCAAGVVVVPFCNILDIGPEFDSLWAFFLFCGPAAATTLLSYVWDDQPTGLVLITATLLLYGSYGVLLRVARHSSRRVGLSILGGLFAMHYLAAVAGIAIVEPTMHGVVNSFQQMPLSCALATLLFIALNSFALLYGWPRTLAIKPPSASGSTT